jgi:CheY-like chemotaxis protein
VTLLRAQLSVVKNKILYVDDNKDDALLVKRALKKHEIPAQLFTVRDGCDAADWLTGNGDYSDSSKFPAPDLLIVDLRMPRNTGFDLLEFVQARRELKRLPIIVYTSSEEVDDKRRAFGLGANAYVSKRHGTDDLMVYVRSVVTSLPIRDESPE